MASKRVELRFVLFALVLTGAGLVVRVLHKGDPAVGWWLSSNYLVSYDIEFLKRGLLGTVLAFLGPVPTKAWIDAYGFVVLLACVAATCAYLVRAAREVLPLEAPAARKLLFLAAASPAFFLQYGYDMGRLDQLGAVLFLASLAAVQWKGGRHRWIVAPLAGIAILNHESYAVVHLPVVVAVTLAEELRARRNAVLVPSATLCAAALALGSVQVFGDVSSEHRQEIVTLMVERGSPLDLAMFSTSIWVDTLGESIAFTGRHLSSVRGMGYGALLLSFVVANAVFFRRAVGWLDRTTIRRWIVVVLCLAPFGPLLLFAIGVDAGRWCSWTVVNLTVVLLYLMRLDGAPERVRAAIDTLPAAALGAWVLGPAGLVSAFPWLVVLAKAVIR